MLSTRKTYVWDVVLQPIHAQTGAHVGAPITEKFRAKWDPTDENITDESIAISASAQKFVSAGRKMRFLPISAQLATA